MQKEEQSTETIHKVLENMVQIRNLDEVGRGIQ